MSSFRSFAYLGHIATEHGTETDPSKIERVRKWPLTENVTEVKSFLGLASYYRRFCPKFADVARPLYKLTEIKTDLIGRLNVSYHLKC